MELVEGASLRELCGSAQPVDSVIRTGQQIANALAEAHVHGIVHRDVKPENIMVRGDGYVKVLDFGLARQMAVETAGSGLPAGTLRYMSPEQIRGEPLTGASDVFSLGLTLYELLTGRHPFESSSAFETAVAIAREEPQAPSQVERVRAAAAGSAGAPHAGEGSRGRGRPPERSPERWPQSRGSPSPVPTGARPKRKNARPAGHRRAWIAAAAGSMLLAAGLVWYARRSMLATAEPALRQITATPSENRVTTAAISSDGEKLAYAVFDGTLFIRRPAGDVQTVPARPDFRIDRIAWWPDERRLLVSGYSTTTQGPSLWMVPLDGAARYLLRDGARDGSPSPDGTKVAFTQSNQSEIWTMELGGQSASKVVAGRSVDTFPVVLWSSDGKHVIYQRRRYFPRQDSRTADLIALEADYERTYESVNIETGGMAGSARKIPMTSACALRGRAPLVSVAASREHSHLCRLGSPDRGQMAN